MDMFYKILKTDNKTPLLGHVNVVAGHDLSTYIILL